MAPPSPRPRPILAALAAAAVLAISPAPARAWLRDFRSVPTAATPLNSNSPKSLVLSCPGSHFAIGVGAQIRVDDIELQAIAPIGASPGSAVATAAEVGPISGGWALRAPAWCVNNTDVRPSGAAGASYVKDVMLVRNQSSRDSDSYKPVVATCPAGLNPIGGGFGIVGPSSRVAVRSIERRSTEIRVVAYEREATAANWAVEALSICANITTAASRATYAGPPSGSTPGGLSSAQGSSSRNSVFSKGAVAACPAGQNVVGGGAEILGDGGPPSGVAIKLSRPSGSGTTGTRWIAIAYEVRSTGSGWEVRAYAKCAALNGAPSP